MNAFSSGGENGTGVSGAAIRFTGASRSSNPSSAIVAAISAPKPPLRVSSWSTSTLDVFRADALQTWDVRERRLPILRVARPAGEAPAGGKAHRDRHRRAGAPALFRGHRDEVVPRARDEIRELHLRDRPHAHDRGAGAAGD